MKPKKSHFTFTFQNYQKIPFIADCRNNQQFEAVLMILDRAETTQKYFLYIILE